MVLGDCSGCQSSIDFHVYACRVIPLISRRHWVADDKEQSKRKVQIGICVSIKVDRCDVSYNNAINLHPRARCYRSWQFNVFVQCLPSVNWKVDPTHRFHVWCWTASFNVRTGICWNTSFAKDWLSTSKRKTIAVCLINNFYRLSPFCYHHLFLNNNMVRCVDIQPILTCVARILLPIILCILIVST